MTKDDVSVKWLMGICGSVATAIVVGFSGWAAISIHSIQTDLAGQSSRITAIEQRLTRMPQEGSDVLASQRHEDLNRRLTGIELDVKSMNGKLDRLVK